MTTPDTAGPCHNCRHHARCTAEQICCEGFFAFARSRNDSPARWAVAPRFPSRDIMQRLQASVGRSAVAMRKRQTEVAELQAEVERRRQAGRR